MEKNLLVISNHNPDKWSEGRRHGWDSIEYVAFPNIAPGMSMERVYSLVSPIIEAIIRWVASGDGNKICLQGEYSAVYIITKQVGFASKSFIFPTTERKSVEVVNTDGSVTKSSEFRFIRWRNLHSNF